MSARLSLLFIVGIDLFILLYQSLQLSISYNEIEILAQKGFLSFFIESSLAIFGHNDIALRVPMILLHMGSIYLLYQLSKEYILKRKDRVWLILIYALLPGVISSALVINSAGVVLFFLFFFLYVYKKLPEIYSYILLVSLLFIDTSFIYLYLSLMIYAIFEKKKLFFIFNSCLFFLAYYLYGLEIQPTPSGYFLDTIGVYLAIFSPPIFIYVIYALYRRFLQNEQDIIWYIASTLFLYTFFMSIRQKIALEHIGPYLIISLPIVASTFLASYRIRLPIFRKKYKYLFFFSLFFLVFNSLLLLFNKELYSFLDKPNKHFAYNMHIAKELAYKLKKKGINCLQTDEQLSKRLEFYGISQCKENSLRVIKDKNVLADVTVSYSGNEVFRGTVTKLNNK